MYTKKLFYNDLLLKYNRYELKLKRLKIKGSNFRKQNIIQKKLQKLSLKLCFIISSIEKKTALTFIAGGILVLQSSKMYSQNFMAFQTNPFSLTSTSEASNCSFADLDNDGDLDMISGSYNADFYYFENVGTSSNPNFGNAQINPFSLSLNSEYWSYPNFVDMDDDGDFDLISGCYSGNFYYFENVGSGNLPQFANPSMNPFSLTYVGYHSTPAFADIDHDGDLDMMSGELYGDFFYFENTGSISSPSFPSATINPFSLTNISLLGKPSFADFDSDNDLDLITGNSDADFVYYKNIGSNSSPYFDSPVINPNALTNIGEVSSPTFVDIDNDQDLDLISGSNDGNFYYFEKNCSGVSTEVSLIDNLFTATQSDAIYQWLDCNNGNELIPGETNQSYLAITSGSYSVEISFEGCTISTNCYDVVVCDGVSISTNTIIEGNTIIANQTEASYQWLDCNNSSLPMDGETNPTFTFQDNGSYAVQIELNGCTAITDCIDVTYVGLSIQQENNDLKLFPNPTNLGINIVKKDPLKNATVAIRSITGQLLSKQKNISVSNFFIDLEFVTKGIYFLEITENKSTKRSVIIKE